MKYIVALLLTIVLAFALSLYLPWYAIAIAGFLVTLIIPQSAFKSFTVGFVGIFILWASLSVVINSGNQNLLLSKISQLLPFKGETILLIIVGAMIGAIVGGVAGLTGHYTRRLFK